MIKTIVELVLSEASNFDLMYTATEVAVEQSSIFTNLCRQGTEMLHDNVEKGAVFKAMIVFLLAAPTHSRPQVKRDTAAYAETVA